MRLLLYIFALLILFSSNADAMWGSKANYRWWKDENIASQLELTRQQSQEIDKVFKSYKKKFVRYRRELEKNEAELKKELSNPKAKREDVLKIIDNIENTKAAYTRTKVEMYLKVRDVLTPEQEATLHKIKLKYKPYYK